jgi:hypothetical protein
VRSNPALLLVLLAACSSQVSDLDDLQSDSDACDPRGRTERGTALELTLRNVSPHINQDMFFAVTQGKERNIESMFVLSTLDDPNLKLVVPKLLPAGTSELAFWADSEPLGFDDLDSAAGPDHQWTRPICPNGKLTFTHSTPFQDVENAISAGAVFVFEIPSELRRQELFDSYRMWLRVTQLSDVDNKTEVQTRAFFRWSPYVPLPGDAEAPPQRGVPDSFQVGNNVLGEGRGPIDTLSFYNIEFVIDLDDSATLSGKDVVCRYTQERAPGSNTWRFEADFEQCDTPSGFDAESGNN